MARKTTARDRTDTATIHDVKLKRGAGGEVVSATLLQGGQKLDGKRK